MPATDEPRLSVGYAMSEQIQPEDIGRLPMVEKVAAGVKIAMERAGITDPADVHYVQTKTPLLTLETITDAKRRGKDVWTEDTLKSMDVSNSTTALGIAVALGEIDMPTAEQIHKDLSLFSSVASCSSGVELDQAQIVVLGNVRGVGGRFRIGHSVMKDALDADGVWESIRSAGLDDLPERPRTERPAAAGSSTSSASARPTRPAGSATGATSCSTTPTCTGTGRSSRASAAWSRRSPATRRSSSRSRRCTRAPRAAGRSSPSSSPDRARRRRGAPAGRRIPDPGFAGDTGEVDAAARGGAVGRGGGPGPSAPRCSRRCTVPGSSPRWPPSRTRRRRPLPG